METQTEEKKKTKSKNYKFSKIKSLKCHDAVLDMLYSGFPPRAVARYIQNRNDEYTDVTYESLVVMVHRYRESLAEGDFVRRTLPTVFEKAEMKFSDKLEELKRLENLWSATKYRFDMLHGAELYNEFRDETGEVLEVYHDRRANVVTKLLVDISMKMHSIKMDLGLTGSRDLGTITVSAEKLAYIKDKYGDGAAKAFSNPVSRSRVLAVLGATIRAGKLKNEDGSPVEIDKHMDLTNDEKKQLKAQEEVLDADFKMVNKGKPNEQDSFVEESEIDEEEREDKMFRDPQSENIELEQPKRSDPRLPPGPLVRKIRKR